MVPNLTESVSVDADGVLHITMTNVDLEKAYPVEAVLAGEKRDRNRPYADKNTLKSRTVGVQGFTGVQAAKEWNFFTILACSVPYRRKIENHKPEDIWDEKDSVPSLMDGNTGSVKNARFG